MILCKLKAKYILVQKDYGDTKEVLELIFLPFITFSWVVQKLQNCHHALCRPLFPIIVQLWIVFEIIFLYDASVFGLWRRHGSSCKLELLKQLFYYYIADCCRSSIMTLIFVFVILFLPCSSIAMVVSKKILYWIYNYLFIFLFYRSVSRCMWTFPSMKLKMMDGPGKVILKSCKDK